MKDVTLKQIFFSGTGETATGDAGDGQDVLNDNLTTLEGDIKEQLPKVPFKTIRKELMVKLGEVLSVGLEEILGSAWTKYRGIREYADLEKHPPGETVLLPLADHKIESAHSPHVDLMVRNVLLGSIGLDIALVLTLESVVLKLQGGKIRSIQAGSCQASGSLSCAVRTKNVEKELLGVEQETPKLDLAVAIPLGDGIEIAARSAAGADSAMFRTPGPDRPEGGAK